MVSTSHPPLSTSYTDSFTLQLAVLEALYQEQQKKASVSAAVVGEKW